LTEHFRDHLIVLVIAHIVTKDDLREKKIGLARKRGTREKVKEGMGLLRWNGTNKDFFGESKRRTAKAGQRGMIG